MTFRISGGVLVSLAVVVGFAAGMTLLRQAPEIVRYLKVEGM